MIAIRVSTAVSRRRRTCRRFADPETDSIPGEQWPQVHQDICRSAQLPEEGEICLGQRRAALEELTRLTGPADRLSL
jgi:hypothetical protein